MILGHSSLPTWIQNWIYSFHMPFFFFISGVLTKAFGNINEKKTVCCAIDKAFLIGKSKALLLPFLIYSAINLLVYPLYGKEALITYSKHVLLNGWEGVALWFIPVFFVAVIVTRLCSVSRGIAIISAVVFAILGTSLDYYDISLPWTMSTVPFACVYMLLGFLLKNIVFKMSEKKISLFVLISIIGLIVSFVLSQRYRLDMASNKVLPAIPLLIAALSGIFFLLAMSMLLEKLKLISFGTSILKAIGKHTYELLAFSQAIILILNAKFHLSIVIKYLILVVALWGICIIRDKLKTLNLCNRKI